MRGHIKALQALVASLSLPCLYGDATGVTTYPYVLLWSTAGSDDVEPTLTPDGAWSDLLGVTVVDTTALNVLTTCQRVRDLLDGAVLDLDADRHATLHLQRGLSQTVRPDRDIKIPGTDTHPCFAVDRYLLVSQPTD